MSSQEAPRWVVPVMRFGYAARGVVYIIVGVLAVLAAWSGGQAEGTAGALKSLRDEPWGTPALWVIGIGLFAYAVWRLADAWMDLENYGHGFKGVVARTGQTVTGLLHVALGIEALRLGMGSGGSGGSGPQSIASRLMQTDYGPTLVMIVGVITICSGVYYGYKGFAEKYKEHIRCTRTTERLDPAIKAGLVAHGIVIVLIGVFLFYAGLNTDPGQAGGLGKAFATVRAQPFGRISLGLLGLGMLGFALYCFVEAIYRVIARLAGDDVTTLATKAKGKARRMASEVR